MQDFRSFTTLSDRIFGAPDRRRVRSFLSPEIAAAGRPPPPLRCPRCDSLNTKFCYYNNYNLSQPRHFCKSCRRYWTNGGVLRNVPVGGSCRKPKRSSCKNSSKSPSGDLDLSQTSSDRSNTNSSPIPCLDRPHLVNFQPFVTAPDIFPDLEESFFPDLIAPSGNPSILAEDPPLLLRLVDRPQSPSIQQKQDDDMIYRLGPGRGENRSIDFLPVMDLGPYELAGAGDQTAYWSQNNWDDADLPLYLP